MILMRMFKLKSWLAAVCFKLLTTLFQHSLNLLMLGDLCYEGFCVVRHANCFSHTETSLNVSRDWNVGSPRLPLNNFSCESSSFCWFVSLSHALQDLRSGWVWVKHYVKSVKEYSQPWCCWPLVDSFVGEQVNILPLIIPCMIAGEDSERLLSILMSSCSFSLRPVALSSLQHAGSLIAVFFILSPLAGRNWNQPNLRSRLWRNGAKLYERACSSTAVTDLEYLILWPHLHFTFWT